MQVRVRLRLYSREIEFRVAMVEAEADAFGTSYEDLQRLVLLRGASGSRIEYRFFVINNGCSQERSRTRFFANAGTAGNREERIQQCCSTKPAPSRE